MARMRGCWDTTGVREFNRAKDELNSILDHQRCYWQQRAKQFWYKEGDTNSHFFHKAASVRKKKRKNSIQKLRTEEMVLGCIEEKDWRVI